MQRRPSWRIHLFAHAAVAFLCGVLVLVHSLKVWQPCYANGYDTPACFTLQTHETGGDTLSGRIYFPWLVTLSASTVLWILTALARNRDRLPWAAAAALVVPLFGNPLADYLLAPMLNGGYVSHDAHPGQGVPVAVSLLASGLLALVGAVWRPRRTAGLPGTVPQAP